MRKEGRASPHPFPRGPKYLAITFRIQLASFLALVYFFGGGLWPKGSSPNATKMRDAMIRRDQGILGRGSSPQPFRCHFAFLFSFSFISSILNRLFVLFFVVHLDSIPRSCSLLFILFKRNLERT